MRPSRPGIVDPNNLFVTGGSGGGVLTAWIVGKTDRFRAAATQKPVIDLASFVADDRLRRWLFAGLAQGTSVGGSAGLLEIFAAQPGRQRQDADARRGRQRGLSHAGQRGGAILHGAAAARRTDGAGEGARRKPRRHCRAAHRSRRPRPARSSPGSSAIGQKSTAASAIACQRELISPALHLSQRRHVA